MKRIKMLALLIILAGFALQSANAQAIVQKGDQWRWNTGYDWYTSHETHEVYTPSCNTLIILTFHLDLCDPLVPDKGINKVYLYDSHFGCEWVIFITPDGKALLKMFFNGADKT
jgi:hypothetical protein